MGKLEGEGGGKPDEMLPVSKVPVKVWLDLNVRFVAPRRKTKGEKNGESVGSRMVGGDEKGNNHEGLRMHIYN